MNFEVMESVELDEFTGSNPQIAKRKRTKRRRMALSSSSSGGDGDRKGCIELEEDRNYELSTVTTMSSEEEDEDMANCLMMLARSGSDGGGFGVVADDSGKIGIRKRKSYASRKPAEISAGGVGLNNVYECKTCDKAFQSFQALGGHRASHHKKAKGTIADVGVMIAQEDVKPCNTIDQIQLMLNNNNTAYSTAQPSNTKPPFSSSSVTHSTKVHQCSICGSAFSSGQALGGHMRRHRAAAAVASSIDGNQISSAAAAAASESPHEDIPVVVERVLSNNNFLSSLDLNLPAPAEEDHHTRLFHQQLFPTGRHDNNSSAIAAAAPSCMFSAPPPTVGCYF